MKRIIKLLLVSVIFLGCSNNHLIESDNEISGGGAFHTITVDSCEYIFKYCGFQRGYCFSHKGNCRYCKERNKR